MFSNTKHRTAGSPNRLQGTYTVGVFMTDSVLLILTPASLKPAWVTELRSAVLLMITVLTGTCVVNGLFMSFEHSNTNIHSSLTGAVGIRGFDIWKHWRSAFPLEAKAKPNQSCKHTKEQSGRCVVVLQ